MTRDRPGVRRRSRRSTVGRNPPAPAPERPRSFRLSGGGSDVGTMLFAIVAFALMLIVPAVGRAAGWALLAAALLVPATLLVWALRPGAMPLRPLYPLVVALSHAVLAVSAHSRHGPDGRTALTVLAGLLWLAIAGVAWSRPR